MTKFKAIVALMLIAVGLGLCIGGAFFPPLLVPGVPMLSAGLTMMATTEAVKEKILRARSSSKPAPVVEQPGTLVEPPVLSFSHNYHVNVDHTAPARPNTPVADVAIVAEAPAVVCTRQHTLTNS